MDLHIHTTASDGTWNPENLVKNILSEGIKIFAVTDHDSLDNLFSTSQYARDAGLFFIPGVEITVSQNNLNYHILGYGIDTECDKLREIIIQNRVFTEDGHKESINYLTKKGYSVSLKEYK